MAGTAVTAGGTKGQLAEGGGADSRGHFRGALEDQDLCGLYHTLFTELAAYIARRTDDRELAEDIAQETLLRALSNNSFDWSRPVWPWLKVTATRLLIAHVRGSGRESVCEIVDREVEPPFPLEEEMVLTEAISQLPRRQRVALSLHYVEGWSQGDAASFLGLTRPAFKQLLMRSRGRLRIEYRRLTRGAGLLLPVRLVRRAGDAALRRIRSDDILTSLIQTGTSASFQLLSGLLAVVITASGASELSPRGDVPYSRDSLTSTEQVGGPAARQGARSKTPPTPPGGLARAGSSGPMNGEGSTGFDPVNDFTDPNSDVREPEDVTIVSVSFVPGGGSQRTAFATGATHCRLQPCPPILFRSDDHGSTWTRLKARNLSGSELAIPPGFGSNHEQIFAMGATGLQVSKDGGGTFESALGTDGSIVKGALAISPMFDRGDPTVLIGGQMLMRYNDVQASVLPEPTTALRGPFTPSFAPEYPADGRILLGGLNPTVSGSMEAAMFICEQGVCEAVPIPQESLIPTLVPHVTPSERIVYAHTANGLYVWGNGGDAFEMLPRAWTGALADIEIMSSSGRILASVRPLEGSHSVAQEFGLYGSADLGRTWVEVVDPLFRRGAGEIAASGDLLLVALPERGLACSSDGGRTWAKRCRPAA